MENVKVETTLRLTSFDNLGYSEGDLYMPDGWNSPSRYRARGRPRTERRHRVGGEFNKKQKLTQ